jgi:D-glycerate 3-kinase
VNEDALAVLEATAARAIAERNASSARPAARRAPIIAISGAQGSGKSTLAAAAARARPIAVLSLDDFYLTHSERRSLAAAAHPLFQTRGPPGTHDLALLRATLDALGTADEYARTPLPRFDKRADDRVPARDWPVFSGRPQAIILEGWCLGAAAQAPDALAAPLNALERDEDPGAIWRTLVNEQLAGPYQEAFARLDVIVALEAPGFEVILDWRCEQEETLRARRLTTGERAGIARFISHYERITRHMLDGFARAETRITLDERRRVVAVARA